jgi:hypothetical protein
MNLAAIKEIINSDAINWENLLLEEIAKDVNAIPSLLNILHAERQNNAQLITDLNSQLSRAHVAIENPQVNKDGFVQKEIRNFYAEGRINHCFNMD